MEILLSHRRSQVGFNEFEPSCANIEGRGKTDATSLGSSEAGWTGALAAALQEDAGVEVSAGGRGSSGVGTKCFKMLHLKRKEE